MEGARCDEQDVVCLDHAVLGIYGAAFHQRQQITLHALARYVGPAIFGAFGDLVDFIDKDNPVLFDIADGLEL